MRHSNIPGPLASVVDTFCPPATPRVVRVLQRGGSLDNANDDEFGPVVTGMQPEMCQDSNRELSKWFAGKPDAPLHLREAAAAISDQMDMDGPWTLPPVRSFAQIRDEADADARAVVHQPMQGGRG